MAIIAIVATVGALSAVSVPVQTVNAQCVQEAENGEFKQECDYGDGYTTESKVEFKPGSFELKSETPDGEIKYQIPPDED